VSTSDPDSYHKRALSVKHPPGVTNPKFTYTSVYL